MKRFKIYELWGDDSNWGTGAYIVARFAVKAAAEARKSMEESNDAVNRVYCRYWIEEREVQ